MDPRDYMELAVKVMKDSMAEPRADGKLCPFVGAVLVKSDGSHETSCRGELRSGDHAEYTLLERKNADQRLDRAVLYVTLEPCAPGARGASKASCAERIALARVARVYVGVEDPDPKVDRQGIKYLQEAGVEVALFDRDLQDTILEANAAFIGQAEVRAEQARSEEVRASQRSGFDSRPGAADFDDLSAAALEEYRVRASIEDGVGSPEFARRLARQGILLEAPGGALVPTGFGLMAFGARPRDSVPQVGLLATIQFADGTQETKDFDGPLVLIPEAVEAWLKLRLPNVVARGTMLRREVPALPFEMVREAVVNALVHRDYDIEGAKCQMVITPDVVTVRSPGGPVPPITLAQMQTFSAPMLSRNPRLHYVFARMGLAEERGLGIASLKHRAQSAGLPLPRYVWHDPYLDLTVFRTVDAAITVLPQDAVGAMSSSEVEGWKWLAATGATSSPAYAQAMKTDVRNARRHLARFVEMGLAVKEGSARSTVYRVL